MTLEEARAIYASHSGGDIDRYNGSGLAGITEAFYDASGAEKRRIWEVFFTFALAGDEAEASLARHFLFNNAAPADAYAPLVAAVRAGGHPNLATIEAILGAWPANLDDADRAALTQMFVANPVAHFALAGNLVRKEPRGPAWDAFALALDQVSDMNSLVGGYESASLAARQYDYALILAKRDPALLSELAPLLPSGVGEQLLRSAGLP